MTNRTIINEVLTEEKLLESMAQFPIEPDPIVGFKVSYSDLRHLEYITASAITPCLTFIQPEFGGLKLFPNKDLKSGDIIPVRYSEVNSLES